MVEKKFNFYAIFNSYYKNINKSVPLFLYIFDNDFLKDYRPELYSGYTQRIFANYFGIYFIITSNYIIHWDLITLNNINILKKKRLVSIFNLKKIYTFNFKKYVNKNLLLFTLIS